METEEHETMRGKTDEFYLILPEADSCFKNTVSGTVVDYPFDDSTYMDSIHILPASADLGKVFVEDQELESLLADLDEDDDEIAVVKVKITDIFFAKRQVAVQIKRSRKRIIEDERS